MPVAGADEQQVNLAVIAEADPLIEVAAAEVLLLVLEEMRNHGIVVHHVDLHIDS